MENTFTTVGRNKRFALSNILPPILFLVFLGASIHGAILHGWKMFLIMLPHTIFMGVFAWCMHKRSKGIEKLRIDVTPESSRIVFHNFRFETGFLPGPPREEEVVAFSDLIAGKVVSAREIERYYLRTTKGKVSIPYEMEHFDALKEIFNEIIGQNKEDKEAYADILAREPKIKTPWYAWVIYAAAIAGTIYLGWWIAYSD